MATYGALKTRIATELSRNDLEAGGDLATVLGDKFAESIEWYADDVFWFNRLIATTTTTASTISVSVPSTFRRIDRIALPDYDIELVPVTLEVFEDYVVEALPQCWSYYNDTIRLYPTPDSTYTLRLYGLSEISAPSDDSDTSIWTNEAQHLIVAHTKMLLARDVFRDPEGVQLYQAAVLDNHAKLKRETARRLATPLRMSGNVARRYNFNTDG